MSRSTRSSPAFLALWFFLAYGTAMGAYLGFRALTEVDRARERHVFYLQHVLRMSRPLLKEGRLTELGAYLRDSVSTGLIDYFELQAAGKTERLGVEPPGHPVLAEPVAEAEGWVWGRAEAAEGSLRLASAVGWRARLAEAWEEARGRLPMDLLLLAFAYSVAALSRRPEPPASRRPLGAAAGGEGRRPRARRAERDHERERPRTGEAGDFSGVCGRSRVTVPDELRIGPGADKLYAALEDFYSDCAALLARYGAGLHAAYGREMIFFLPDGSGGRESRLALAAARDLGMLAKDRGLRLATALSHGRLHARPLLGAAGLLGRPVDTAATLLQELVARDGEGIWVVAGLTEDGEGGAEFRGLAPVSGLSVKALVRLPGPDRALDSSRSGDCRELTYHRGDGALEAVLRILAEDGWERGHYLAVVNELRRAPCRRCGPAVARAYRELLEAELERRDSYRLSSALALAGHFLSRSQVDGDLERLFLRAAAIRDRRVRANAVELFTYFFPEREIPELRPLLRDDDNRVSANVLIKAACERFDERVILRIEERVRGGSVAHVASALYAMGEIALYYRRHDPLFLGSKISFLRLFDDIGAFAAHPNPMIVRQALVAARKLRSEAVDARLRELLHSCDDPALLELFAGVYGWRREERAQEPAA